MCGLRCMYFMMWLLFGLLVCLLSGVVEVYVQDTRQRPSRAILIVATLIA